MIRPTAKGTVNMIAALHSDGTTYTQLRQDAPNRG